MKFKLFFAILTFLSTTIIHAHFYRYALWGYKDKEGKSHFVHTFSDVHERGGTNAKQQNELISTIPRKCGKKNSLFIVEDPFISDIGLRLRFFNQIINPIAQRTPLACITRKGYQNSLNMLNVEFRYTPILDYCKTPTIDSSFVAPLEKHLATLDSAIAETFSYQDTCLNSTYEKLRGNGSANQALLKELLYKLKNLDRSKALLITGRSIRDIVIDSAASILDIRTLHQLAQNRDKKNIFICQGGWHIKNIEEILPNMGFRCLVQIGNWEDYTHAIKIGELFTSMPNNFDEMFNDTNSLTTNSAQFLEKAEAPIFSTEDEAATAGMFLSSFTLGILGFVGTSLGIKAWDWYNARQEQKKNPTPTKQNEWRTEKQPTAKRYSEQRRYIHTRTSKPTQPLPVTGKLFAPRSPRFTPYRFTSRPFRFAAAGLAGLGALGAYAWFGRS